MFKLYNFLFWNSLFISTMISISSPSWMGMWIGLEMNLLSFIPLMNKVNNPSSSETAMKYFMTQAIASAILIFSVIVSSANFLVMKSILLNLILTSSLLTKMGAAPFHFWFPEVMEGLNWINSLILLTWQKISPMVLMFYNLKMSNFLYIVIISCLLISGIMGLNQIILRKILAYSSINHISWMLISLLYSMNFWITYFLIYSLTSIVMVMFLLKNNIYFLQQIINLFNNCLYQKMTFIFLFFSLGGIPPFIGFFPKWIIISTMINAGMLMLAAQMILLTMITLFYYLQISFNLLLFPTQKINISIMEFNSNLFVTLMTTLLSLIMVTLTFNF